MNEKTFDGKGLAVYCSNVRMACKVLYTRRLLSLLKEMTQVLFNKEPLGKREKSLGRFEQTAHMMLDMIRSNGYLPLKAGASSRHYFGPIKQVLELSLSSGHCNLPHGAEFLENSPKFMEIKSSLPCSQKPDSGLCPETVQYDPLLCI
jgi:hypothetical protein